MQQLSVEITIPIPADCVLVKKVDWEDLKKVELEGVYWSMQDLERRINKKCDWIKEHILYPPRFKRILDIEQGGFVYYPKIRGQNWSFQASKMAAFLDKRFIDIFKTA